MIKAQSKVKQIKANGLSGTMTTERDSVLVELEYEQTYWGLAFLLIPWLKTRKVKTNLVRSRNGGRFTNPVGHFDDSDVGDIILDVLYVLCDESFEEFDEFYPEEIISEVELSDGETFDVVDEIVGADTYTETADDVAEVIESIDETFNAIDANDAEETLAEILAETEAEMNVEVSTGYVGTQAPSPERTPEVAYEPPVSTYSEPPARYESPSPAPSYPSPSYDSSPSPSPSPSYSSPSPSPSYDSSPSSDSSSSSSDY